MLGEHSPIPVQALYVWGALWWRRREQLPFGNPYGNVSEIIDVYHLLAGIAEGGGALLATWCHALGIGLGRS